MLKRIRDFLVQDVSNENEVKMYAIIMRIMLVVFLCYSILSSCFCAYYNQTVMLGFNIACIVVSIAFFYTTYCNKTRIATFGSCFWLCLLMLMHSIYYGINTGVYQAIYVLIILIFAIDYLQKYLYKIILAFIIIAYRIWLHGHFAKLIPVYRFDSERDNHWQAVHMITFIAMVIVSVIISTADFTEMRNKLQRTNNRFRDMAGKDPLTNLYNRRSTQSIINEMVEQYKKEMIQAVTIVMADVDHFKNVNDTYGHDNGDIVLVTLANDIGRFMRGKGIPSRWGGEEFLLVFSDINGDDVYQMLFELQKEIAKEEFDFGGDKIKITLTYGVAEYGAGDDIEDTIKEADEKLYMGKERGRNTIVF